MRKAIFPILTVLLLGASNLANGVALVLLTDNTRSSGGTLSFQAFKTCAPAVANGCYNPTTQWYVNNNLGANPSSATWSWDGITLAANGQYWTTSFIGSNPNASPVISDKTVNLRVNTATRTTTATSYNCVEGTFLSSVGANGCLNSRTGDDFVNQSTGLYNVGGNANCVQRTLGGDDFSGGNPRGLFTAGAIAPCNAVDGAYDLYDVVSDETATGGPLVISNGIALGSPSTHYLTFAVVPPDAVDDGPVNVAPATPAEIDVLANDTGFADPVTVTVTTAPTKGVAAVVGTSPGPQSGITIEYTADAGATGTDSFVYRVLDANGTTADSATVSIAILQNGANPDSVTTTRNHALIDIPVGANDLGFTDPATITVTVAPNQGGTATPTAGAGPVADAIITYTPAVTAPNTPSYTETFTYQVTDADNLTQTAIVTVQVNNTVPVAGNGDLAISTRGAAPQTVSGTFNVETTAGNILGNTPSTVTATNGTKGTTAVSGNIVTYTPGQNFLTGTDTFSYTITDSDPGTPDTSTGTVTVTIRNVRPAVGNQVLTTTEGIATASVPLNIGYGNGSPAQHVIAVSAQAANGTCTLTGTSLRYTPNAGFTGTDRCLVSITDEAGAGDTATGTMTINVEAANAGDGGGGGSSGIDLWSLSLLAGLALLRRKMT